MARAARYSSRIDVAVFVGCLVLSIVALVLPAPMREPIAESLRRTVVAPLVALERGAEQWRMAWAGFQEQTSRTDSLAVQAFEARALRQENDQFRRLLGLGGRLGWGFIPAEALHNTAHEDVVTTITLTAGSNAGVKRFLPVVAPDGIVGLVQTADPTMSIAILFSHPDFRASAMSADGSSYGIVYPHLGIGAQRYLLELRNVPFRTALKPGTLILTSGLGGSFPRGVPIGTVLQELRTAEGWTRTYLVRPMVNPGSIAAVMILTPQRIAKGVGGIWASVASVDSAAKKIAAAGDSLARQEALAEAAARRAALDSAARGDTLADTTRPPATAAPTAPAPATTPAPAQRDTSARIRRPIPRAPATVAPPTVSPPTPRPLRPDTTRVRRTPDTGVFALPRRPDTTRRPPARPDSLGPTTPR